MHKLKKHIHAEIKKAMSGIMYEAAEVRKCKSIEEGIQALNRMSLRKEDYNIYMHSLALLLEAEKLGRINSTVKATRE